MRKNVERIAWSIIGIVALVAIISVTFSIVYGRSYGNGSYFGPYYGGYGMMDSFGIPSMWVIPVIALFAVIVVVTVIYVVVRSGNNGREAYPRNSPDRAEEIANGEIDQAQYQRIMDTIRKEA